LKTKISDVLKNLFRPPRARFSDEDPIRAEIYSTPRLESQAAALARSHRLQKQPAKGPTLSERVSENSEILENSYQEIIFAVEGQRAITPAAEWLIDNFHIVRAQLKDIHDHLPPKFYRELPKLAEGPLQGYPRVFALAWFYVAHTDSHFDEDSLKRFLQAYQKVRPLTIGELWAVPITLRLVLMENLRRLAVKIVESQRARKKADDIANEILGLSPESRRPVEALIEELEKTPFTVWLAVQLLQRLRFQESDVEPILQWLDRRLQQEQLSADSVVSLEHNSQTAANATARNIINSSRLISAYNWRDFVEDISVVDGILRQNPFYPQLDFATRDRYRHSLEHLARHCPFSQVEVAEKLVSLAAGADPTSPPRYAELGYYLISRGRPIFEQDIQFRPKLSEALSRSYLCNNTELYLGSVLFFTLAALAVPMASLSEKPLPHGLVLAFLVLGLLPASEIALHLVNRFTVALLGPQHLPRLDLEKGIPEKYKTFVVVPSFLTRNEETDALLEQLEIHYLSNPEGHIHFALLTDWVDATRESLPGDLPLLQYATDKLDLLNRKHPPAPDGFPRFYLFHRRRLYNPQEGKWIAWERKRGKLHEFNQLLLGEKPTSHVPLPGKALEVPPGVRYVITLDADTKIPKSCVAQLVGTLAHPLNHACFDAKLGRVSEGYGILQPRLTPTLPTLHEGTVFQRLSSGPSGVDPYATAVSDVYQDLFNEGSYTGKGIYDLRIFEKALKDRIPENSILSHDLFEGNLARCAFLSDVEFFEEFPSHAGVAALRSHRWIRGDWQLLPWIFGRERGAISVLGRWKMLDNLRRSLLAPAAFFLLILALGAPAEVFALWLVFVLLSQGISVLINFFADIASRKAHIAWQDRWRFALTDLSLGFQHTAMSFLLLPFHAWIAMDALLRALYRMFISHRHLLEWTTAAQLKAAARLDVGAFFIGMRGALLLVTVAAGALIFFASPSPWLLGLLFVLWMGSPAYAYQISRPREEKALRPLSPPERDLLHLTARRIWLFFASFVGAEDHSLPPDNFQLEPEPVIAHRSSPTNFGLYLLAVLAARNFGWISRQEALHRLSRTLESLQALPKHEGHFFNWYETTTPRALDPKYISSVDNGNLAGHLIAVAQGIQTLLQEELDVASWARGLEDSFQLLAQALKDRLPSRSPSPPQDKEEEIRATLQIFEKIRTPVLGQAEEASFWQALMDTASLLKEQVHAYFPDTADNLEVRRWAGVLQEDVANLSLDFRSLMPWLKYTRMDLAEGLAPEAQNLWRELQQRLGESVSLEKLPARMEVLLEKARGLSGASLPEAARQRVADLILCLEATRSHARECIDTARSAQALAYQLFSDMDFSLLFDKSRKLFSIGLRVSENTLDPSYYDLLASESRVLSFIAIAKGDVPVSHWFSLGRSLTQVENGAALVSWSGSMFEYLMPSLVMNTPEGGLIKRTCDLVIERQVQYARERDVPWGISESAYNKRDRHLTYQYSNFGVPDLSLKRGQGMNLVVAPYASLLAAMYEPSLAAENLKKLADLGAAGLYGYYEAVDFTSSRLPANEPFAVVKTYMAHHQGMSLVSLANLFMENIFCRFFHAEPLVQATEILLQERLPRTAGVIPTTEPPHFGLIREDLSSAARLYHAVNRPTLRTQLLSNGRYTVMMTAAGSGYSRYQNLAVTRWREDATQDRWGTYLYFRDVARQHIWSPTYQPLGIPADRYEVTFSEDRVHFEREEEDIHSHLEVFVSPESQAEVRRIVLTNQGKDVREIEVTSYSEIVLNTPGADAAHPAFSNLFIQTEYLREFEALLAHRRPRSDTDPVYWAIHSLCVSGVQSASTEYETDRQRFLGRGRDNRRPHALFEDGTLSNTLGSVLDPVFSLRTRVRLDPGVSAVLCFSTGIAQSKDEILQMAESFHEMQILERISALAWSQAQVKMHYLNIEPEEAHLFQRLASRLLYLDASLRPSGVVLKRNVRDLTQLWALGISGDDPIVVVRIEDWEDRAVVRQLLKAQEYFAFKNFVVDLVIMNSREASYSQELQDLLASMIHINTPAPPPELHQSRGKVFLLREDILSREELIAVYSEARAVFTAAQSSLSDQVSRMLHPSSPPVAVTQVHRFHSAPPLPLPELEFFNGLGGFTPDGREYVIVLKNSRDNTPAPWVNVISNGSFGFLVSERGSGYTWSLNSRENQLTPWSNDPVSDPSGEAFYFYDHASECIWSPTAQPIRLEEATYIARHGQGYSRFEHASHGVHSELTQFVPLNRAVKVSRLRLENLSTQARTLSVYAYVEWVLGFSRPVMAPQTITEIDEATGAIFATNVRSSEFGHRVAFAGFLTLHQSVSGDRREFIGRNCTLSAPAGVVRGTPLSNHVGAALDPCGAFQTTLSVDPGKTAELVFVLGQAESREAARNALIELGDLDIGGLFKEIQDFWQERLEKIQVDTPDTALNLLLNRWLLYQNLSCRFWARSAFYQAGGAYGFRDQLQDSMALIHAAPELVREQILRAARRQFVEGDVQHWWHPPSGRGVRTHFSDDLLWLPFVVHFYLEVTHDSSVLEEEVPFLEGPALPPDKEDAYFTPAVSLQAASLYEHCARALDRSLKVGVHGLPLMGSGDWNDGMNRVGKDGRGESVWMGWFLAINLQAFLPLAVSRNETARADAWAEHVKNLKAALELHGWDGDWYRRAFYDDGTPLGSASNSECRIDSLAQTWAVISGLGDPARSRHALQALESLLVDRKNKLLLLFTPPFDKTPKDPGYIKGYLPGVRENGGQYTHAAAWCVIAFALLGEGQKAVEFFGLINPIRHSLNAEERERYKIEPYAVAGDVYSQGELAGRGGWSWYTGSAGWMYRAALEFILGFQVRGEELFLNPQISPHWPSYRITYRYKSSTYRIIVENPGAYTHGIGQLKLDGQVLDKSSIPLQDDGQTHEVKITLAGLLARRKPPQPLEEAP